MKPRQKLDRATVAWLDRPGLKKLLQVLNENDGVARLVGGCVRDSLMGRPIGDIDVACSLHPEEAMSRLEKAGIKVIPTGLKHGTITAVSRGEVVEVTALRRDVETYGRHADVAFTDDWLEDARRRDLTVNAFYLDADGTLYDPCDGWQDLQNRHVRFIGQAEQRIQEDALRILRFFRFAAQFDESTLDEDGLAACIAKREMISNLSGERLAQEMKKLLSFPAAERILPIMAECGILDKVLPDNVGVENFLRYIRREKELGLCSVTARLATLMPEDPDRSRLMARHLRLSGKETSDLADLATAHPELEGELSKKDLRRLLYHLGRTVVLFRMVAGGTAEQVRYVQTYSIPSFPLQGRDLLQNGEKAGPELGQKLKKLEQLWEESDYTLAKEQLLAIAE
ncbi:CCA tRNA nucleotidyltransferase [Emcibacter sp.]|uniref:CCA tRNA nucleotidyltransferase n=1 Tax=Emcibacter sp. TaxID=1979954 RepID=UPI002AA7DC21|nr:CCA tRNA nucleotidyltransferase [Emcibacter sp.]